MISESLRESASLYAVDALEHEEKMVFERTLASDPELQALVDEFVEAASLLALSVAPMTPPPGLRDSILSGVRPVVAEAPAPVESTRSASLGGFAVLPWGLAAAFAVFAGILWSNNQTLRHDVGELANLRALSEDLYRKVAELEGHNRGKESLVVSLQEKVKDLEKRKALAEMQVETLTSKLDASYLASVVWDGDAQEGVLHVRRLPESERGKDYQLWVIDPDLGAPVSAGVFSVEPDGSATMRFAPVHSVKKASTFAITVEESGGKPAPEGPVILAN